MNGNLIGFRKFILFLVVIAINVIFKIFGVISENAYVNIMMAIIIGFSGANAMEWWGYGRIAGKKKWDDLDNYDEKR